MTNSSKKRELADMPRDHLEEYTLALISSAESQAQTIVQLRQDFKDAMRLVRATNFNQEKNDDKTE